ncbi:hypothetical protein EMN47_02935 [Prolixibacteraceae bacterium JC049]|nr:hypothetical protein [Prolixibacteraceae bacterium JC049]
MQPNIKLTITILWAVLILSSCQKKSLEGNWAVVDNQKNYSEMYFTENSIRIYHEKTGLIPVLRYKVQNDSLKLRNRSYKIEWRDPNSITMRHKELTLKLIRIQSGFTLSDLKNPLQNKKYKVDFNKRMYVHTGKEIDVSITKAQKAVEPDVIDIKK